MNIRGGRHAEEYWSVEAIIQRAVSGKSNPKYDQKCTGDDVEPGWCCQVCGERQDDSMPQYLIPFDSSITELFKICVVCKHKQFLHKIDYISSLIQAVRNM